MMHKPFTDPPAAGDSAGDTGLTGSRSAGIRLEPGTAERRVRYGYDPYETLPAVRHPDAMKRHVDLRALSEQIRRQRQKQQPGALPGQPREPVAVVDAPAEGADVWPDRR